MKIDRFTLAIIALPLIACLCGVILFGMGIFETATSSTKNYAETTGYFYSSALAEDEHYDAHKNTVSAPTYYLTYKYFVDGEEYKVTSSSPTAFVPSINEEIKILYDSENPEKAVIGGPAKRNNFLMILGIFFIIGSLPFLVVLLPNNTKKKKSKNKEPTIDSAGILFGSIIAVMGYGALAIICGSFSPVGIINYLDSSFTLPMIIPFLMIAAGLFSVIKSIFFYKK